MSDPTALLEEIAAAEDAFGHAHGRPNFEPELNSSSNAGDGEVQIQKSCRLVALTNEIEQLGEYYGAILEGSFIAIEHTLQGYLLAMTGADENELRDHATPYALAKGQVPLEVETIDALQRLYEARRTKHYYGTTVTTEQQARQMRAVARLVHEYLVSFDGELERFCICTDPADS